MGRCPTRPTPCTSTARRRSATRLQAANRGSSGGTRGALQLGEFLQRKRGRTAKPEAHPIKTVVSRHPPDGSLGSTYPPAGSPSSGRRCEKSRARVDIRNAHSRCIRAWSGSTLHEGGTERYVREIESPFADSAASSSPAAIRYRIRRAESRFRETGSGNRRHSARIDGAIPFGRDMVAIDRCAVATRACRVATARAGSRPPAQGCDARVQGRQRIRRGVGEPGPGRSRRGQARDAGCASPSVRGTVRAHGRTLAQSSSPLSQWAMLSRNRRF